MARFGSSVELSGTRVELSSSSVELSRAGMLWDSQTAPGKPGDPSWGGLASGQGPGASEPGVASEATRDAASLCKVLEKTE